MLFAVLVLGRIGIGVAAQPELLDESVALLIVAQVLERLHLLVGDDPANVLVQPLLVDALQLCLAAPSAGRIFPCRVSVRFNGSGFSTRWSCPLTAPPVSLAVHGDVRRQST